MSDDKRYELALYIGPCSEDEAEALAESILGLEQARAVHAGAISISPEVNDDPLFAEW